MPFKSKAQRRKFYAMADRGEISDETVERWEEETPKKKKLPERVKKAVSEELLRRALQRAAAKPFSLARSKQVRRFDDALAKKMEQARLAGAKTALSQVGLT